MPGYGTVLDFDGNRVAVGVNNPNKTVTWSLATDTITKVSGGIGYNVDLATNRLARFTKDPYQGGCTVVSTLLRPDDRAVDLVPGAGRGLVHQRQPDRDGRRARRRSRPRTGLAPQDRRSAARARTTRRTSSGGSASRTPPTC